MKLDPRGSFGAPMEVVRDSELTREQKLEILRSWELDARELETAAEENMAGGEPSLLSEVRKAIESLAGLDPDSNYAPNKQGAPY